HAHLSGAIPLETLKELHRDALRRNPSLGPCPEPSSHTDLNRFFIFFDSILYNILDTPLAITKATAAVLDFFAQDGCIYLELRTTPRKLSGAPLNLYLQSVVAAFANHDHSKMIARLILSINWDFDPLKVKEIVDLAIIAKDQGHPLVGLDLCGDPQKSFKFKSLLPQLHRAKQNGLKLTIHFAEIPQQINQLSDHLIQLQPDRLGHANFLSDEIKKDIILHKRPIEICITSNLKTSSVPSLEAHHFKWAVEHNVPVLISTDDPLVFETNSTHEYSLALSLLKGNRQKLLSILSTSILYTFCSIQDQEFLLKKLHDFDINQT
ncbi:hypothetical protein O181_087090, partial [Austropuccinia psidii MF-1]|nr:hypothetical protein [Austropuccinia psidii MF-1]